MSVAVDMALRVAPAVATFALGRAWPYIVVEVRSRQAKRFWSPLIKRGATMVVGRHIRPEWEASGLLGIGDVRALETVRAHLRALKFPSEPQVTYDDEVIAKTRQQTWMAIGGPFANPLSRELWQRTPATWTFRLGDPSEFAIRDERRGELLVPARDADGELTVDYGVILSLPNPFAQPDTGHRALAFAGCYGQGTLAAARYATLDEFIDHELVRAGRPVECLVTADIVNGAPQRLRAEVRELDIAS